jgi:hypothetical protein
VASGLTEAEIENDDWPMVRCKPLLSTAFPAAGGMFARTRL